MKRYAPLLGRAMALYGLCLTISASSCTGNDPYRFNTDEARARQVVYETPLDLPKEPPECGQTLPQPDSYAFGDGVKFAEALQDRLDKANDRIIACHTFWATTAAGYLTRLANLTTKETGQEGAQ